MESVLPVHIEEEFKGLKIHVLSVILNEAFKLNDILKCNVIIIITSFK